MPQLPTCVEVLCDKLWKKFSFLTASAKQQYVGSHTKFNMLVIDSLTNYGHVRKHH